MVASPIRSRHSSGLSPRHTSALGRNRTLKFSGLDFVYITPHPGFSRLVGTDERVLRLVEMFGGVLVLGRITTSHMSTNKAQAQVNPGIAGLNTVLTDVLVRFFDFDLIQVGAFCRHRFLREVPLETGPSDLSHVTKGHQHCQGSRPSLTMVQRLIICVSARLFILRVNDLVHNSSGATLLGRLGSGRSQ